MKVFVSWSGTRSHTLALAVGSWLHQCLHAVDPIISTELPKGSRWETELSKALGQASTALICLTADNLRSPWLLFEAGAISNQFRANVCTLLLDGSPRDMDGPLAQFQHTVVERDDMWRLLQTISTKVHESEGRSLSDADLRREFEEHWPGLEAAIERLRLSECAVDVGHSLLDVEHVLDGIRSTLTDAWALKAPTLQREVHYQCCLFAQASEPWGRGEYRSTRDRYNSVLLELYTTARSTVFATCVSQYLSTWRDELGTRILSAHTTGRAKVTRVFRFDTRKQIDGDALRIMRLHADTNNVSARVFIDDEDPYDFPEAVSRDFSLIDDGEVIGITLSYGTERLEATWYFKDAVKARVLKEVKNQLLKSSRPLADVENEIHL